MPLCVYGLSIHHCNLSVCTCVLILEKDKSPQFWQEFFLEMLLKASFICKDRTSAESCYKYWKILTKTLAVLRFFFLFPLSIPFLKYSHASFPKFCVYIQLIYIEYEAKVPKWLPKTGLTWHQCKTGRILTSFQSVLKTISSTDISSQFLSLDCLILFYGNSNICLTLVL